jgi:thioredoxin-related protein
VLIEPCLLHRENLNPTSADFSINLQTQNIKAMNNYIFNAFLLLLSLSSMAQREITPLSVGSDMPQQNHPLIGIDGKTIETKDLMGQNGLIIIFSCNTCPFVVGGNKFEGWEKDYNGLYELASKLGFNLVLVNSNEAKRDKGDSIDDMKERAAKMGYKMDYYLDMKHVLADAFGAKTTPHVFFFNKEFKLVYTGSIDNQMEQYKKVHKDYLKDAMNAVAKGKNVKINSTPPIGCSIKRIGAKE